MNGDRVVQINMTFQHCNLTKILTAAIFVVAVILYAWIWHIEDRTDLHKSKEVLAVSKVQSDSVKLKYILLWSSGEWSPFYHLGQGQERFNKFNCPYKNCFVTDNRTYLSDIEDYDAIVFNGNYVIHKKRYELPSRRKISQKYVFAGTEPSEYNLACEPVLDGFFNWTWTYRLDSDLRWGYIAVYDAEGVRVAPQRDVKWPVTMHPIEESTKAILDGKSKAAAWFVSRCHSLSHREDFVKKVKAELKKFRLSVDVYGACGPLKCPKGKHCFDLVKKDYYFYFSFENSMSVDYVTEKLLTALNNYAIPVVLGRANYSRFLPPGSYLNALELGPKRLAQEMRNIINNRTRYYDFFRWRNHFQYKQSDNSIDVCNICTALNDPQKVNTVSTHEKFRDWWNHQWSHLCH